MALPEKLAKLSPQRLALLALELQERVKELENARPEPVAVVGMACRFPMSADSPAAYWDALSRGVDGISEVPRDRFDIDRFYDSDLDAPGKMATRWGGFLDRVDTFDAQLFGISPREAETMDPQQRLLMEVSWQALEDAAIAPSSLSGSATGVFVGMCGVDYFQRVISREVDTVDAYWATGGSPSIAAGRLAYTYGFMGPAMSIDTACSSSLVALHQACLSLRAGECHTALAAGSNVILSPVTYLTLSKAGMMAPDGRCKAFDASANGFVRAEGCGVVVLRRLSDAVADGDRILAVVRGSAINQDGRSNGLTAPSRLAQEAVIRAALADADVRPASVGYVEAHGTGTSLGDPIEAQALGTVLGAGRDGGSPVYIGSVKTNMGHLEEAAGIAGFIKTVLALQARTLPPSLHFNEPSPHIPWAELPVRVVDRLTTWEPAQGVETLIAGVSSFGFSGTNAHVILEQAPPTETAGSDATNRLQLLTLSAASEASVRALAASYSDFAATTDALLADICFSANTGRERLDWRIAVPASNTGDLSDRLASFADDVPAVDVVGPRKRKPRTPRVAFLFTGQGAQYAGMSRELYEAQPVFRAAIDRCNEIINDVAGWNLISCLHQVDDRGLDDTAVTQPALFALEYALAELWNALGVEADYVLGHSLGEYVAATHAGLFSLEDGLRLVTERGRRMQDLPPGGGMTAVFADEESIAHLLGDRQLSLSIAAVNGPMNVVVSGAVDVLEELHRQLDRSETKYQPLRVSHAFHSELMEPMRADFEQLVSSVEFGELTTNLISNVTGRVIDSKEVGNAAYWSRHIAAPVRFGQSIQSLLSESIDAVVEVGPHPTLLGLAQQVEGAAAVQRWLPSLRRGRDDSSQLLESLAELFVDGADIDWAVMNADTSRRRISLPTYRFDRRRHWIDESRPASSAHIVGLDGAPSQSASRAVSVSTATTAYEIAWRAVAHPGDVGSAAAEFLSPSDISAALQVHFQGLESRYALDEFMAATSKLDAVARHYAATALRDLGIHDANGSDARDRLAQQSERNARLLDRVEAVASGTAEDFTKVYAEAEGVGSIAAELELLTRTGRGLSGVVRGDLNPLEVLFPGGDSSLVERIYRDSPPARAYNELVRESVRQTIAGIGATRRIKVLEIGAGTGSTTASVLDVLPADRTEYCFTDVSKVFLDQAGRRFADRLGMRYELLDIEREPSEQGFGDDAFDIVIAANVIHATADIRSSVANIQKLLAPGGALVLLESTGSLGWVDLTFGITDSWWKVSDTDLRPAHPMLDRHRWTEVLVECGFAEAAAVPDCDDSKADTLNQAVILARAPERAADAGRSLVDGCWIIVDSGDPLSRDLAAALRSAGAECRLWSESTDADLGDDRAAAEFVGTACAHAELPVRGVVHTVALGSESDATCSADQLDERCRTLTMSAIGALRELVERDLSGVRFWTVTRNAQRAAAEDTVTGFVQAVLWGMCRSASAEHPTHWGGLIDVSSRSGDSVQQILLELTQPSGDDQVALREGGRWVPRLAAVADAEESVFEPRSDATYLITGGLGGIGLLVAEHLVARGARSLALVGRSAPSPDAETRIGKLNAAGARVETMQADVSVAEQVDDLIATIGRDMTPLRGVIHTAGVFDDSVLTRQDWSRYQRVLAPKVKGAANLHRATSGLDLDVFALFASGASLLAAPGISNYAAANSFLDSFAAYRRGQGLPGTSFDWGPWSNVGMAKTLGAAGEARWAEVGFETMDPADCLALFDGHAVGSRPQIAAFRVDWERFRVAQGDAHSVGFYVEVTGRTPAVPTARLDEHETDIRIAHRALAAAGEQRVDLLTEHLHQQAAGVLRLPHDDLDAERALIDSGLDSLMAVELRNRIERDFDVAIPVGRILAGATVRDLASTISTDLGSRVETEDEATSAPVSVDDMTDADVDAMLEQLLAEERAK